MTVGHGGFGGDFGGESDAYWRAHERARAEQAAQQTGGGVDTTDWSWVSPVTGGVSTILTALGFGAKPAALPAAPPQVIVQQSAIPTWVPWVAVGGIGLYLLTSKGKRK